MMDWEPWMDRGIVRATDYGGRDRAMKMVHAAWDCVVGARAAYLRSDWDDTDAYVRKAFVVGTHALLLREELEPKIEPEFEVTQRIMREFFKPRIVDPCYERARIVRELMPLEDELPEEKARLVRRSVGASSEFVALIEGHCFF